jgi:hypothetical protein
MGGGTPVAQVSERSVTSSPRRLFGKQHQKRDLAASQVLVTRRTRARGNEEGAAVIGRVSQMKDEQYSSGRLT